MPNIPGLRSCYDKVGRVIYFGRMLDKIRLHAAGQLPQEYQDYLGERDHPTLDRRICNFLGVPYSEIRRHTLAGEPDEGSWSGRILMAPRAATPIARCGIISSPSLVGATDAVTCSPRASKKAASKVN